SNDKKFTVFCIHGLCSDARIFNYLGSELSKNGINVISIDILGHGKSEGKKGDPDFDQCLQGINEIIEKYKSDSKVFILAHSMGSTFALWYARQFKHVLDGIILMAPYIRIKTIKKRSNVEPNLLMFFNILFRRIFTPSSKVSIAKILPGFVRYGGDEVLQMLQDSELDFEYSYRYIIDVLARRNDAISVLSSINIPLLILHGKNDMNIFSKISEEFIKIVDSKDKTIQLTKSDHWFYDAIFYNQDSPKFSTYQRQQILKIITSWILHH
ncbi:MAG: alpha/beta fold hydrolase, partial [Thaumarchaeota archaeon]|nr:alpha/beta fold hydrolase [Nitrososphaerota archaeon]